VLIETKHFGQLEIEEKEIIDFPEGIPGFPEIHRYIPLEEKDSPFLWLQAVDNIEPCFVLINPETFYPNYVPYIDESTLSILRTKDKADLVYYTIVVVPEDFKKMRTNLQAPLAINFLEKVGKQVILNQPEYQLRYYIFQELQGGGIDASANQEVK